MSEYRLERKFLHCNHLLAGPVHAFLVFAVACTCFLFAAQQERETGKTFA